MTAFLFVCSHGICVSMKRKNRLLGNLPWVYLDAVSNQICGVVACYINPTEVLIGKKHLIRIQIIQLNLEKKIKSLYNVGERYMVRFNTLKDTQEHLALTQEILEIPNRDTEIRPLFHTGIVSLSSLHSRNKYPAIQAPSWTEQWSTPPNGIMSASIYEKIVVVSFIAKQWYTSKQCFLMKWVSEHISLRDLNANPVVSARLCVSQSFISSAFHRTFSNVVSWFFFLFGNPSPNHQPLPFKWWSSQAAPLSDCWSSWRWGLKPKNYTQFLILWEKDFFFFLSSYDQ